MSTSHFRLACVAIIMCLAIAPSQSQDPQMDDRDEVRELLFEEPVGDSGLHIVVTRGPYLDPKLIAPVRRPPPDELQPRYYEVRAELRAPAGTTIPLASRLRTESGTNPDKGSVVLDALLEPGRFVFFMAEGADLFLWDITVPGGATWTILVTDRQWRRAAAAYRLDSTLIEAELSRLDDGRLSIELLERTSGYRNRFEESGEEALRFRLVRQWEEN